MSRNHKIFPYLAAALLFAATPALAAHSGPELAAIFDKGVAAYDAGASKWRAHWEVTLPLCKPGLWAGSVLIFLLGVGVFLEPKVLGGGKSPMSAELIRQTFETRVNWPLGAALTLVLMVVAIFVVLLFSRVAGMRKVEA